MTDRSSWWVDAVRGGLAGAVATWLMDLVTTGLYDGQSPEVTEREKAAQPNGKSSVENLLDRIETETGFVVEPLQRPMVLQAMHYALGIGPGAVYGVLRNRLPLVGAARGLLFGLVVFAVNDEYMNTKLGLAGPIEAYPVETHWRGLVGHATLGVATDTTIELLGG
ncbi:MAG: DUF1440 domain-containing protein [Chloroflexota bacterium]